MDRPIPPSNFKTQDGNVREDLRRLRVYLEQLNDWLTENTNADALTQAQADLLYLLRAANDFGTFTHASAPAAASRVLIEDSAASFAKKYSTLAELGFSSIYGAGSVPLYVTPAQRGLAAGTLDDEFDSTTLNAAWITRDTTTGPTNRTPTVGAFNENTVVTGATAVPKISLHTQGRRSWLTMITSDTAAARYLLYKPFTWTAGQVYWTRFQRVERMVGYTGNAATAFAMWANSGGFPDLNNRLYLLYDRNAFTVRWGFVLGGVATDVGFNIAEGYGLPSYMMIANPAGVLGASSTWYGEMFDDNGLRIIPNRPGNGVMSFTPAFIGWSYSQDYLAPATFQTDFIRENTGHPLMHL
jgi:hypothetical protein